MSLPLIRVPIELERAEIKDPTSNIITEIIRHSLVPSISAKRPHNNMKTALVRAYPVTNQPIFPKSWNLMPIVSYKVTTITMSRAARKRVNKSDIIHNVKLNVLFIAYMCNYERPCVLYRQVSIITRLQLLIEVVPRCRFLFTKRSRISTIFPIFQLKKSKTNRQPKFWVDKIT
ncbi:Sge1p [Saccharomyces cerevisiae x Saccharomyces kudriavzevii VIN7]|uniref:Sge1p n=1 Tax=Saccharomyces cerevisiae x Saccharomyces kudriavzevii (strain VIN7) TaxID=1095631 RepID=H0H2X4_SACCK|nr:Sge1p [Saccharomyces cerevisiae x Saccharomyces kudriavzevii VIN7]